MSSIVFRAIWPLVDESIGYADLCRQAAAELPELVRQAHAELERPGRFSIAPSDRVPGSGRTTEAVLVYEAPARSLPWREYWKASA